MASTTVRDERVNDKRYIEIAFDSAGVSDTHEVKNLPVLCTITRFVAVLVSGTGTTIDPTVGRKSASYAAGGFDELGSDITGAPAARVGTVAPNQLTLGVDGSLFVRPNADAGVDNAIRVELQIKDGWISP